VGRRLAVAALLAAAVPVGTAAAAAPSQPPDWAAPQIETLASYGLLMGATSPASFHPNDPLTRGALADLTTGLAQTLEPISDPGSVPVQGGGGAVRTTSDEPVPVVPSPTVTDPTTTAPSTTVPTTTVPTTIVTTVPTTTKVAQANAPVTMASLDAGLVSTLGLSDTAAEFVRGARAAGLTVPARFGTEMVARLLGLRVNHPAAQDFLELRPQDPATRAEAAYSGAQILGFGWLDGAVQLTETRALADSFSLPALTDWQKRILDVAVSKIGMPYVWGGTSDGSEEPFGVHSRGGYDCSGFVWRVYKLQSYPNEGDLASTLKGRTTFTMSVEVPKAQRIPFAQLQPADVLFFGTKGPRSAGPQVVHMGIYLGNGWFIQSSDDGVAVAQLIGWYRETFAWARRPLAEANLEP